MLVFVSLLSIIQQQIRMDDGIFWKIEALQSKTNPIDPVIIVTQQLLVYDATRYFDMSHDVGSFGFCGFDTWLEWIEICVTWCACALCVCMYDLLYACGVLYMHSAVNGSYQNPSLISSFQRYPPANETHHK